MKLWRKAKTDTYLSKNRLDTNTIYDPTGTCGMGRVVDERLRVMGVRGLRVVDASVMPFIVRANTKALSLPQ